METSFNPQDHTRQPISLAPMVDKSDRDWRWIIRHITRFSLLYTEMHSAAAIIHGNREKLLAFDSSEKPLVLQIGWNEASQLAEACRIAEDYGYDEINLNCGCPSDKVQRHQFGASLMAHPDKVAGLFEAMAGSTNLPVTVKNRIGIRSERDGISMEEYDDLYHFVERLSQSGCRKFIVHARIAILDGLSPKENREIPPLRWEDVYKLKQDFPHLFIEINGGFKSPLHIDEALKLTDAVMLGRLALDNPWMLSRIDRRWFGQAGPGPSRREILQAAIPYMIERAERGASRGRLIQATMNIFAGRRGAKTWKRAMTAIHGADSFAEALQTALDAMDAELLDERC